MGYFWKTLWKLLGTKLCFSTSYHPQTDGQTEVTNCTLGVLLRGLVRKTTKDWDVKLSHAEFAYNRSPTYAIKHSPFEVVYGLNLRLPIDLIPMPRGEYVHVDAKTKAESMLKLHSQVRARIEKVNERYKTLANRHRKQHNFKVGDLVWLHLRKERFPNLRKNKLMPRTEGPFKILEKVNNNAFKLELPGEFGVSATFNVGDLAPYIHDDDIAQLRTIVFKEEEDDTGAELLALIEENVALDFFSFDSIHGNWLGNTTRPVVSLITNMG